MFFLRDGMTWNKYHCPVSVLLQIHEAACQVQTKNTVNRDNIKQGEKKNYILIVQSTEDIKKLNVALTHTNTTRNTLKLHAFNYARDVYGCCFSVYNICSLFSNETMFVYWLNEFNYIKVNCSTDLAYSELFWVKNITIKPVTGKLLLMWWSDFLKYSVQ